MEYDKTRQTLIERIRNQNDGVAWEEFVESYELYIYAIIRRMGISADDCKDIHQDVLLKIWNHLPDYRLNPNTRFRGWLSTVTANSVRNFLRSRANKSKTLDKLEDSMKIHSGGGSELDRIAEEEWENFLADKAMSAVSQAFSGKGIEVFQMSLQGKSIEEISKALGLEESSVYQLRARVKKSLVKEISRLREELD